MVIKPMMVPARIFFILAISRYLHKDDYGLSQNDRGRFTDYRNFLFVVAVFQKSTHQWLDFSETRWCGSLFLQKYTIEITQRFKAAGMGDVANAILRKQQ